jgi:hypothetical protein
LPHLDEPAPAPLGRLQQVLWVVAAVIVVYPLLMLYARFEAQYFLPNGTVLVRALDWKKGTRIDLRRWTYGAPLIRDVEFLCFDDEAMHVTTYSTGSYIWLKSDAPIVRGRDPDYYDVWRASGLSPPEKGCVGYFSTYVGGDLLLDDPLYDWRYTKPGAPWCPPGHPCRARPSAPAPERPSATTPERPAK